MQVFIRKNNEWELTEQAGEIVNGEFIPHYNEINFELAGHGAITGLPFWVFKVGDIVHGLIEGQLNWNGAIEQRRWSVRGLISIINDKGVYLYMGNYRPNSQALEDVGLSLMAREGLTNFG